MAEGASRSPYFQKGDPFGIYVHWPFCQAKCPYCDFNSHVRHKPVDQETFVSAYQRELDYFASLTPDRTVTSIFFGGGTPSLMEVGTLEKILDAISKNWDIDPDAEISLEANPTSVEATHFRGYRKAGVNRVSCGVQSLQDDQLKFMGRLHSANEARKAIELARDIFPRLSFDLIYARPNQKEDEWAQELSEAIDLAADHLSLYQLTIEKGTPFFGLHQNGKLSLPNSEIAAKLYQLTQQVTASYGLPSYEISNHAKAGAECQHNLLYWRYQDYVGVGPGAHGRVSIDNKKIATVTEYNPEIWWQKAMVDGNGLKETESLIGDAAADEFLLMGLRLKEGIKPARYEQLCGKSLNNSKKAVLIEEGFLLESDDGKLRATASGALVLDALVADLAA